MTKRVLIIDDEESILEILNLILTEEGYTVILSNTGDAISYVEIIKPDLIMLDIRISGSKKNGAELCAELKKYYSNDEFPIVLISAESDIDILADNCGADAFIRKPFDIDSLLVCVRDLIN